MGPTRPRERLGVRPSRPRVLRGPEGGALGRLGLLYGVRPALELRGPVARLGLPVLVVGPRSGLRLPGTGRAAYRRLGVMPLLRLRPSVLRRRPALPGRRSSPVRPTRSIGLSRRLRKQATRPADQIRPLSPVTWSRRRVAGRCLWQQTRPVRRTPERQRGQTPRRVGTRSLSCGRCRTRRRATTFRTTGGIAASSSRSRSRLLVSRASGDRLRPSRVLQLLVSRDRGRTSRPLRSGRQPASTATLGTRPRRLGPSMRRPARPAPR